VNSSLKKTKTGGRNMRKILIMAITALTLNAFALDITGLWEITTDVTLNEDLHVLPGGVVRPKDWSRILTVNGNIINEGTIEDGSSWTLAVNSAGHIYNSGTWNNYRLTFLDSVVQEISSAYAVPFAPLEIVSLNPLGIKAKSDLEFQNCNIWMNSHPIDLTEERSMHISGGYLSSAYVTGAGTYSSISYLNMSNGAHLMATTLKNLVVNGTTDIGDDSCVFDGKVVNSGTLQNRVTWTYGLNINGDFDNLGTIRNNPDGRSLNINFNGANLYNAGTWSGYMLTLSGTAVQNISNAYGYPFTPEYTSVSNTSGILAKSNLEFTNSLINFTDNTLDLREGRNLFVSGGYINRLNLLGAGTEATLISNFEMSNECYIQNSTLTDLFLTGTTNFSEDTNILEGKVVNTGTIQNKEWWSYTLTINGDFDNLGTIRNNPAGSSLNINFNGANLYNTGTWSNQMLSLTGSALQNISNAYGTPYSPVYTSCSNTYGILAKTDLEFTNSLINFTDNTLDLREGRNLFVSGGYINRLNLLGAGTEATLISNFEMSNECYIQNSTLTDLFLTGTTNFSEDTNTLEGKVVNTGTIQNKEWWSYTLTINGDFENRGTIQNNTQGYSFTVNFKGTNLYNAGTWTGEKLMFTGTGTQNLSCAFAHAIGTSYTECTNSNGVTAASDLFFNSSEIHFWGYTLDLTAGYDADINGGLFNNVTVIGDPAETYLFLNNSASIYDSEIIDVMLNGWTNIDYGTVFAGDILNTGYLQNKPDTYADLLITGNLSNIGTIQDNTLGWWLNIQAKGNVSNHGTWTNNKLDLNGDAHQHVTIGYGYSISCAEAYITTNIVNGPYEWRYNKTPIAESDPDFSGETIQSLRWLVPMDLSYTGTFYCETGDGASKSVYINDGSFASPAITSINNDGTDVTITWNAIPSAAYYRVFSSDDPYKDHNDSSWFCENENVTTNSWTAPVPVGNKKFYFVTAVY
jgi:hypothetical protein